MSRSADAIAAELIVEAERREVRIDLDYAKKYIAARERIESHPEDAEAQATVRHLEMLLSPFGRFMLPEADWVKHCMGMGGA